MSFGEGELIAGERLEEEDPAIAQPRFERGEEPPLEVVDAGDHVPGGGLDPVVGEVGGDEVERETGAG